MGWSGWNVAYDEDGRPYDTVTGQELEILTLEQMLERYGQRERPPRKPKGKCPYCTRPWGHSWGKKSCVGCGAPVPEHTRPPEADPTNP